MRILRQAMSRLVQSSLSAAVQSLHANALTSKHMQEHQRSEEAHTAACHGTSLRILRQAMNRWVQSSLSAAVESWARKRTQALEKHASSLRVMKQFIAHAKALQNENQSGRLLVRLECWRQKMRRGLTSQSASMSLLKQFFGHALYGGVGMSLRNWRERVGEARGEARLAEQRAAAQQSEDHLRVRARVGFLSEMFYPSV